MVPWHIHAVSSLQEGEAIPTATEAPTEAGTVGHRDAPGS